MTILVCTTISGLLNRKPQTFYICRCCVCGIVWPRYDRTSPRWRELLDEVLLLHLLLVILVERLARRAHSCKISTSVAKTSVPKTIIRVRARARVVRVLSGFILIARTDGS